MICRNLLAGLSRVVFLSQSSSSSSFCCRSVRRCSYDHFHCIDRHGDHDPLLFIIIQISAADTLCTPGMGCYGVGRYPGPGNRGLLYKVSGSVGYVVWPNDNAANYELCELLVVGRAPLILVGDLVERGACV